MTRFLPKDQLLGHYSEQWGTPRTRDAQIQLRERIGHGQLV